jgi:PKHD-type hydroxylase
MILQIAAILSQPEAAAMRAALAEESLWTDGADTAQGAARAVKNNLQGRTDAPEVAGVLAKASAAVLENRVVTAAALPDRLARIMVSRYKAGMGYGPHVDAPYVDGVRTDVSFTLFLSEPADYDGGALVIDAAGSVDRIRLGAGSLVLYPATSVHRVEPVVAGERLAVVGWIKSRVRSAEKRALLFDLAAVLADLDAIGAPQGLKDRLANIRNNLVREFGE